MLIKILKNNKASLETKEILELILAAAGIFILIVLLYQLLAPDFDPNKEAAKSYLVSFKSMIEEVNEFSSVEFMLGLGKGEAKMVYFGNEQRIEFGKDIFLRYNTNKNYLCFCYEKDEDSECDYCTSLEYPASFSNGIVVHEKGQEFEINLNESLYFFEVVE